LGRPLLPMQAMQTMHDGHNQCGQVLRLASTSVEPRGTRIEARLRLKINIAYHQ